MKFSTQDNDDDDSKHNCAAKFRNGWWYNHCQLINHLVYVMIPFHCNEDLSQGLFSYAVDDITINNLHACYSQNTLVYITLYLAK